MDEMNRLRALLDAEGIAWEDNTESDIARTQSVAWKDEGSLSRWSCICGRSSYGGIEGLLELWFGDGDPQGWLTADEALAMIKERLGLGSGA